MFHTDLLSLLNSYCFNLRITESFCTAVNEQYCPCIVKNHVLYCGAYVIAAKIYHYNPCVMIQICYLSGFKLKKTAQNTSLYVAFRACGSASFVTQQARVGPVTSLLGPDQVKPRLVLIRSKISPDLNQDVGKRRPSDVLVTSF